MDSSSSRSTFEGVPVVDVSPFCSDTDDEGNEIDRLDCARQWDQAMSTIGFVVVVGHGIDTSIIESMRSGLLKFFSRDLKYKQRFEYGPYGHPNGGYTSIGGESVSRSQDGHGNLMEKGSVAEERSTSYPADPVESFVCTSGNPREWGMSLPAQPDEIQSLALHYYTEVRRLLDCLLRISEVALNLPKDFFSPYYDRPQCYVASKFYPRNVECPSGFLYGAHTDYTGYTILKPDDGDHMISDDGGTTGGLQVRLQSGDWHNVCFSPENIRQGAFVVNAGDLWEDWTNGKWVSTVHRVVAPSSSVVARPRLSIPFFTGPRDDAVIETLPSCLKDGGVSKLQKPITAGEHLQLKLKSTQVTS